MSVRSRTSAAVFLQLQLRDLFAQPGEFVAADDLQPCEQGLHGRDGTQDAAFYQRQGQRPHLRDREIGLHQPVLGLNTPPEAETCGK